MSWGRSTVCDGITSGSGSSGVFAMPTSWEKKKVLDRVLSRSPSTGPIPTVRPRIEEGGPIEKWQTGGNVPQARDVANSSGSALLGGVLPTPSTPHGADVLEAEYRQSRSRGCITA
jgi:hypothetical protein